MNDKPLLTTDEAAEMFGVSSRHLKRLLERKAFPQPIRLGTCVRWNRETLMQWIHDGCRVPCEGNTTDA